MSKAKHENGVVEYKDRAGEYRWTLWVSGRKIGSATEGYVRRIDMRRAMRTAAKLILAHLTHMTAIRG